jgi:hypothetical protein
MSKGPLDEYDNEVYESILALDNTLYLALDIGLPVNTYLNTSLFYPLKDLLEGTENATDAALDVILDAHDPML